MMIQGIQFSNIGKILHCLQGKKKILYKEMAGYFQFTCQPFTWMKVFLENPEAEAGSSRLKYLGFIV
jgi:hypothetical protein